METLHDRFEAAGKRIGLREFPCSVFHSAPVCIRFQIGGREDIYLADHRRPNGAYIENAVDRALEIYSRLPAAPDLLRIDESPGLSLPGLPKPGLCEGDSCYWALSGDMPFLEKLLREIIRAELEPAGIDTLVSNVYFLNTQRDVLFQLYDDRGADVAAAESEILRSLREACRCWIAEEKGF